MSNLDQKIKEFSEFIVQVPEFSKFQKATEKLEKDKDALALLKNVQERVATINTFNQSGWAISDDQREKLSEAQTKMRANNICMEYLKSQNLAVATARKICNQLTQATGIPFAGGGGCCG